MTLTQDPNTYPWHVACQVFMTSDCIMWSCDVIIKYVILPCDPGKWHCHKIINNWNRWIRLSAPASSEIINLYICILYSVQSTRDNNNWWCNGYMLQNNWLKCPGPPNPPYPTPKKGVEGTGREQNWVLNIKNFLEYSM